MTIRLSDAARREIDDLAASGNLTPREVVDRARDAANPLHSFFTWNDERAADERRLDQARSLIRSVRVEVTYNDRLYDAPKYVHDPETKDQGYVAAISLRGESSVVAVRRELSRALSCVRRAESIAASSGFAIDLDDIASQLVGLCSSSEGSSVQDEAPGRIVADT